MSENDGPREQADRGAAREARAFRDAGHAFPNDFKRDALAGELLAAFRAQARSRLPRRRRRCTSRAAHGQARDGRQQLREACKDAPGRSSADSARRSTEPKYAEFKKWDVGDIVGARRAHQDQDGRAVRRRRELRLLTNRCGRCPRSGTALPTRSSSCAQRYVDLIMSEETREIFRKRSAADALVREFLDALDSPRSRRR
jgi:lysyl-tRNA synthetase class 2